MQPLHQALVMENVTARGNLSDIGAVSENFHADDALWSVELVDFLCFAVFNIRDQLGVAVNKGVMHHASHSFAVLSSVLGLRMRSLASPQLGKNTVSNRRLSIYISFVGRCLFIETLAVNPLVSVLAAKSEHDRAASHAEAAQEDHHEEKRQLLEPSSFFLRKDLL